MQSLDSYLTGEGRSRDLEETKRDFRKATDYLRKDDGYADSIIVVGGFILISAGVIHFINRQFRQFEGGLKQIDNEYRGRILRYEHERIESEEHMQLWDKNRTEVYRMQRDRGERIPTTTDHETRQKLLAELEAKGLLVNLKS